MRNLFAPLLLLLALVAAPAARAIDARDNPDLTLFIEDMHAKYSFSSARLTDMFAKAAFHPEIIDAMNRPKEALPWYQYRPLFVTDERVRKGVEFWRKHAGALQRAQERFGVEPEIIVAIIGVETRFGKNMGRYRVLDALSTLAFQYPSRGAYFRHELAQFLLLTRELDVDPLRVKGSYAGAIGIGQFMPSNYRLFGIDFDGDGRSDLVGSADDAIGSVANYFQRHGWQSGEPITEDATIKGDDYLKVQDDGVEPRFALAQLRKRFGVMPVAQSNDDERLASVIALEGEHGPVYRLVYHNFYMLMRYNRSTHYAMAVYELSREIRERYQEVAR